MSLDFGELTAESSEAAQDLPPMEDELPEEIMYPEYCGIDTASVHRCLHEMHPTRKVAFVLAATGRRSDDRIWRQLLRADGRVESNQLHSF